MKHEDSGLFLKSVDDLDRYIFNDENSDKPNDHTKGWQNLNQLSHPNTTLAPQARQARVSGKNLNYETLAPQERQAR